MGGLAATLSACNSPSRAQPPRAPSAPRPAKEKPMSAAPAAPAWRPAACSAPRPARAYVGHAQAALEAGLGPPSSHADFSLGDGVNEFRTELLNLYPPGKPETARQRIRELTWKHGGCALTTWLAERNGVWTSVLATEWPAGAEF